MKKLVTAAGIAAMAFMLSSCFVLQGFSILATSLNPGQGTKVQFVLHPLQEEREYLGTPIRTKYQFVIVGVPDTGDLTIGKATWGTNGKFGGPQGMPASSALATTLSMNSECVSNGLDLSSITGVNWKGFITLNPINDKGAVDQKAVVQVNLRAAADATAATSNVVFGAMGSWQDDGNGTIGTEDTFWCMGIATSSVYVK
jgi:hypothetical protein